MEEVRQSKMRKAADKIYGGLNMSWPAVIIFAVASAAITAAVLIIPIFKDTSFERIGVTFEAWIFFAIIIMSNCKKPLESAIKTFIFFLVSQPLIYLIQVPFSSMGWKLFGYYKYWFIWTLLTFPMAFAGWYIKKRNWLSLLILSPVLFDLILCCIEGFGTAFRHFPRLIVMAVFCAFQVIIYLYVFTSNKLQKLLGLFIPLAVFIVIHLITPQVNVTATDFLPDEPVLTENAVVKTEDTGIAEVSIESTGKDSMVLIHGSKYGKTAFTITDGEKIYNYTVEIYADDDGNSRIKIEVQ